MSFGERMRNEAVMEAWMNHTPGRNHNGTFVAKSNGLLTYCGTNIAYTPTRDPNFVSYEVVLLNPEYASSPTMKKRIYQVLREFKNKTILLCPSGTWEHNGVII